MPPFGSDDKEALSKRSSGSSQDGESGPGDCEMKETKCCVPGAVESTPGQTSLQPCACGPECGPEKCAGREKSTLVSWDSARSRILIALIVLFGLWAVIYIPISLTIL